MNNPELWLKIHNFKLDDSTADFNFSQRLARDNNWSLQFCLRVIEEYKKFLYLCCAGYGEVTPSDAVDQAWHLHLTYTKSYWIDLCQNTLNRHLHHNPTKGGSQERNRYNSDYEVVQKAYKKEFGNDLPLDIWPSTKQRFSDINFKRINLSNYWIIKKPKMEAVVSLVLLPVVSVFFMQSENPVPWGTFILVFILILFVARTIKGGKGGKGGGSSSTGGGFWDGFWGCSSDGHSGCSSHGCSSGCSGCGGGGD